MNSRKGRLLLCFVAAIVLADACCIQLGRPAESQGAAFQRITRGFGLSAAVSPAWSFFAVDPRIEPYCENELWPIPGLPCYNPYHGALAAGLPPLEPTPRRE